MKKLFETNVNQNADALPRTVDADIDSTGVPYIMYKQFQLDDNFKTHLEGTMQSEHMLRTETKPTPYQNLVELVSGTESRVVDFTEANKQLTFFAISLVYDKSDQHRSIYGRYNAELAITKCLSKVPLTHTVHLIVGNSILATRTTNCYCKACSIASLSGYANNSVFQELPTRSKYFTSADEKIFINLRRGKGYMNEIK